MRALTCRTAEDLRLEHIYPTSPGEQQLLLRVTFGGVRG